VWVAKQAWEVALIILRRVEKAAQRLKSYGVPEEKNFLTGFPLPLDLVGKNLSILKARSIAQRLFYLIRIIDSGQCNKKNVEAFSWKEKLALLKNERT